jgi:signal transduction histidine kinase
MDARAWLRRLPAWPPDVAVALVVVALELVNLAVRAPAPDGGAPDAALLIATGVPLLWRRRFPVTVGVIVATATIVIAALGVPHLGLAVLVVIYGVAARGRDPLRLGFAVLTLVATVLVPVFTPDDLSDIPRNLALYAATWVLGTLQRQRAAHTAELERRAAQLLAQREENARLAAEVERGRIARELHDVIAHAMSVIVVQTGAARAIAGADPERADRILARVEAVGQESLAEVRHVLGRVSAAGEAAPLRPRPGLQSLEELLRRFRDAGLPVELTVAGERRPLTASADLAAYRIVQESLTNALKYAERPTRVAVRLAYERDRLVVEVADDGARAAGGGANGGYGLQGIRERAAALGGTATSGLQPGGGFAVRVTLPDEGRA